MTTFLEPRDYGEYLAPAEREPVHLLRIFPADKNARHAHWKDQYQRPAGESVRQPVIKYAEMSLVSGASAFRLYEDLTQKIPL